MAQSKYSRAAIAEDLQSLEREEDAQLLSFPERPDDTHAPLASLGAPGMPTDPSAASRSGAVGPYPTAPPPLSAAAASSHAAGSQAPAEEAFFTMHTLPADFLCLTEPIPRGAPRQYAPPTTGAVTTDRRRPQYAGPVAALGGVLTVEVVQARLAKNYGLMRMDPYVRLGVGIEHVDSAVCASGGKEPRWNERLQIPVPVGYTSMSVQIFDEGTLGDKLIASGNISLERLLAGAAPYEDWFPLSGQQGEDKEGQINMHLSYAPFVPAAPPVMFYPPPPLFAPMQGPPMLPQAPPPTARVTEADIDGLCEMFPGLGREVVETVLVANRGDREAAVNALLSLAS